MEIFNTLVDRAIAALRVNESITVNYRVGDVVETRSVLFTSDEITDNSDDTRKCAIGVKHPQWEGTHLSTVDLGSMKRSLARFLAKDGHSKGYVVSAYLSDEYANPVSDPDECSRMFLILTVAHD